jgi:uncharacterized protein YyaL (SSP411 family)
MAELAFVGPGTESLKKQFHQVYQPFSLSMGTETESHLPLLEGKVALQEKSTIYVCYNKTCQRPVHSIPESLQLIQ